MTPMITQKRLTAGCALSLLFASQGVMAHGYVEEPGSRSYLCSEKQNGSCGAIVWEPQSVEGPARFPQSGPADGKLASAENSRFSELDEQTASRWTKNSIEAGQTTFKWRYTANHVTRDWRYFITKPGWNPNAKLSRDSFDLNPFCTVSGNYEQPPTTTSHSCNVPERNGYHVIMAVWDIGDTSNSFYQVIDVKFDGDNDNGGGSSQWVDVGDINPVMDLDQGDEVSARVFTLEGEDPNLESSMTIGSKADGRKKVWPRLLAQAINSEHTKLKAGTKDDAGNIEPGLGRNDVFAKRSSQIHRAEIDIEQGDDNGERPQIHVSGVEDSYAIDGGNVSVTFQVETNTAFDVEASIYNSANTLVGVASTGVNDSTHAFGVNVDPAEAGAHSLVVKAEPEQGELIQKTFEFRLSEPDNPGGGSGYDYVYPEGMDSYEGGTRVKGPNGGIYECKPFPNSGWCSIDANAYKPGVGRAWDDAWKRVDG